ncbi:hypothetical protein V6Z11_D10G286400, partial [Gossypium hirsutum]
MASSSSSSRQMKHQVFLSFRGEDTRLNFTVHLLQALKDKGLNVFFDEEKLEKGEELSHALSQAIAASDLSILVLSKDYASSQSCLAELSDIMDRKRKPTDKHIVLPIFYHVDPSDVRNIGGTFKTSFEEHESKRPIEDMKRWKVAFAEIGASKGWHIEGGKSDRFETEYIKDVVEYVLKKLNSNCRSVSEELVGIDDQKKKLLVLIEQAGIHVIGLWGMSGIGKTTLADAVYKEVSPKFECSLFLQNISEKIKKQGSTPSIGSTLTQERLNKKKVLVVLDDVDDSDQIDYMGVKHFGYGSKTIITSRDRQVLESGGADTIHEVKGLNENNSLQLFSTFEFKQLNPPVGFEDLSRRFVKYTQGNPLALKYHVFLSFRGEDTRLNFTTHLLQALKDEGLDVFFDEEKLERGDQLSQALSRAIAVSNISIIVLSADYASSKSCLVELSDIMDRYSVGQHTVRPIFYHVNPSDVVKIDGSFKKSFDEHKTKRSVDEVKQWETAFAEVGKLQGWHIDGSRPETQYIKDIVAYVMQKLMKHQVFLSLGEDTRLNFSNHLVNALEKVGINVFPDNETLKKGEKLPPTYSRTISASNLSILVVSKAYASSKSCLGELSDIMDRKHNPNDKHIVLPVFYHVDPSDVRNSGGHFKTSFEEHESEQPADKWKTAFAEVGKLKGWHIEGGKFDRPETEYIKDIVEYVIKKFTNIGFESASEELVGIEYQKNAILKLIKQKDCRVIGLWGMGGEGKSTLAEAVYKKLSSEFETHCFLQNVREEIKKQGKESLRNKFLSGLLKSNVDIGTPSIGSTLTQERLNKKKVLAVLDDVDDSDQIDYMGVKYFGYGSKTIITSRDRQVLESGGADTIHEVKGLNENDSLQLFSTFAFKQLSPAVGFEDLSRRFVKYTQGNPLALKVLGSDLNKRSKNYWESKVEKLKDCPPEKKISEVLKSSYDGLDLVEQNIFLDIACFFKGEPMERAKLILSSCYTGVECGINKLVDKCLINVSSSTNFSLDYFDYSTMWPCKLLRDAIDMHDMLEEMGKDIVCQESKTLGKCSRLWNPKHVEEVLKYNKGTDRIQGIKVALSRMGNLLFQPSGFESMINLRCIFFYFPRSWLRKEHEDYKKLHTYQDDIISLLNELRYLVWHYYPFKSLSSSFNPKNLITLELPYGNMEQLWNEVHQ